MPDVPAPELDKEHVTELAELADEPSLTSGLEAPPACSARIGSSGRGCRGPMVAPSWCCRRWHFSAGVAGPSRHRAGTEIANEAIYFCEYMNVTWVHTGTALAFTMYGR